MTSKDTKTLEFNQNLKSDQMPSAIHTDLESLIKRIDACKNNFGIFSVYDMDILWYRKKKRDVYRKVKIKKRKC